MFAAREEGSINQFEIENTKLKQIARQKCVPIL